MSSPAASIGVAAPIARYRGRERYGACYAAMRAFTASRTSETPDEIWIVEHEPVYTAGIACRSEHLPRRADIPLERIDRGGQITYHGPGQAVVYTLIDLLRRRLKVRELVDLLEQAVIEVLAALRIEGSREPGAPGVYVKGAKVAALGLRVTRGCSYHGLAINCDVDLDPFSAIDPCGYPGLAVTRLSDLGVAATWEAIGAACADRIAMLLE